MKLSSLDRWWIVGKARTCVWLICLNVLDTIPEDIFIRYTNYSWIEWRLYWLKMTINEIPLKNIYENRNSFACKCWKWWNNERQRFKFTVCSNVQFHLITNDFLDCSLLYTFFLSFPFRCLIVEMIIGIRFGKLCVRIRTSMKLHETMREMENVLNCRLNG